MLWQGIEVVGDRTKRQLPQYQGTVELKNGAVIENAHCGIHTGLPGDAAYATAGGIIKTDSAFFKNNRRAVALVIRNDFDLQSGFSNSKNTGLSLNNCSGYQVEGNRFHRASGQYNYSSTGIRV